MTGLCKQVWVTLGMAPIARVQENLGQSCNILLNYQLLKNFNEN